MADNADESGEQEIAEPKAGQRLAKARRANDISMRDIAKELHLDEVKVQALEDNRFEVLGAPVFAKGYLRKYAELVNVPIDDVLADYYRLNRAVGAPPVVGPKRKKPPADFSPGPWIVGLLLLAMVAAAAYWWTTRPPTAIGPATTRTSTLPPRLQAPPVQAQESAESTEPDEAAAVLADNEPPPGDRSGGDPVSPQAAAPAEARNADTAPQPGEIRLQLRFTGDCWTEVTDGTGRRLFFGLGSDGRVVNVAGVPPLGLLLGNNDNVTLLVNGEDYAVSRTDLRGNTARLTIGEP